MAADKSVERMAGRAKPRIFHDDGPRDFFTAARLQRK
jgi:hypothetical protein